MIGSNPTEPANYRGSNTRGSKELVDIEIGMYQSAEVLLTGTTAIGLVTILKTTMDPLLLKLTVLDKEEVRESNYAYSIRYSP